MVEKSLRKVSYKNQVTEGQLYYESTPAWVTAQESCKSAVLCITYRQLDCLESYHLRTLGKELGEP